MDEQRDWFATLPRAAQEEITVLRKLANAAFLLADSEHWSDEWGYDLNYVHRVVELAEEWDRLCREQSRRTASWGEE
jgi:hypothetical protein